MDKKINFIILGVLAAAIIALYVIVFLPKCSKGDAEIAPVAAEEQLPIAYINIDSLTSKYDLYNQMQDELIGEQERARATINQKASALQAEAQDFQNKLENRAFLSEERARAEQERILRKQQELEKLDAQLSQELMAKQVSMTDSIFNIINNTVKEYNAEKGYHLIFGNTGNAVIMYGNPGYDITDEIVEILNAQNK